MGAFGIAVEALKTVRSTWKGLSQRGIDAHATHDRCIEICAKEPLVDIEQAGEPRISDAHARPAIVRRLTEEHLIQGQFIEEWIVRRLLAFPD